MRLAVILEKWMKRTELDVKSLLLFMMTSVGKAFIFQTTIRKPTMVRCGLQGGVVDYILRTLPAIVESISKQLYCN